MAVPFLPNGKVFAAFHKKRQRMPPLPFCRDMGCTILHGNLILFHNFFGSSGKRLNLSGSSSLILCTGHDIYLDLGFGAGRTDDERCAAFQLVIEYVLALELHFLGFAGGNILAGARRSEERRVGKECRL